MSVSTMIIKETYISQYILLKGFQEDYAFNKERLSFLPFKGNDGYTDIRTTRALHLLHGNVAHFAIRHIKRQLWLSWDDDDDDKASKHGEL